VGRFRITSLWLPLYTKKKFFETQTATKQIFFSYSENKTSGERRREKRGKKHSYQPVFLWALKLYVFCNKNIKKSTGEEEFMLESHKF
jgi:hypothetical protein